MSSPCAGGLGLVHAAPGFAQRLDNDTSNCTKWRLSLSLEIRQPGNNRTGDSTAQRMAPRDSPAYGTMVRLFGDNIPKGVVASDQS